MAQNSALYNSDNDADVEVQERIDDFFASVLGLMSVSNNQPKRNAQELVTARRRVEEILLAKQNRNLYEDELNEVY